MCQLPFIFNFFDWSFTTLFSNFFMLASISISAFSSSLYNFIFESGPDTTWKKNNNRRERLNGFKVYCIRDTPSQRYTIKYSTIKYYSLLYCLSQYNITRCRTVLYYTTSYITQDNITQWKITQHSVILPTNNTQENNQIK